MARTAGAATLALALWLATFLTAGASAAAAPYCPSGVAPHFALGFAALKAHLGAPMGQPIECEHGNAQNGDTHQQTTTGLAYFRVSTGYPSFTNGHDHWALTSHGLVHWVGESVDPPAGGGALLPAKRIVSYYGNPLAAILGVLGEPPVEQMLARLQQQADAYAAADPSRPVQPALELIAVMAQASPGVDGTYRARMSAEQIEQVAGWAEAHGYLLILDVQPGYSLTVEEVQALLPWLQRPYVHLALDPEFTMLPHQPPPGQGIGTLDAATINQVIQLLAEVVTAHQLPPKVLIVHRFLETMVTNYQAIRPDPRVQVVIDMDGFGSPAAKLSKYAALVRDQPVQFAGIKLFYQYDAPLLSPEEVLELDPAPDVVIYQ